MDRKTLRDWVIRFNAEGVEGLRDRPKSGRPLWLHEGQLTSSRRWCCGGPPRTRSISSWRSQDLCRLVEQRFGVVDSQNGMLGLLYDLDLSWQRRGRCSGSSRPSTATRRAIARGCTPPDSVSWPDIGNTSGSSPRPP
jgi:transposase